MPTSVDTEAAQEAWGQINRVLKNFSWEKALVLVGLLVACLVIIKVIMKLADRAMVRSKLDRGVRTFLRSGLKAILWLVALCVLLGYLGVPMTSLVAVLSVLGLAISLAVQGTLSNLAGGIMLLTARPFSAGDFVEAGGVSGTVSEVGLVYTKLNTVDNKTIFVPNGEISGKTIVNFTAADKRQVELKFTASYEAPQEAVRRCIAKVVGEHPRTLPTPAPLIRVSAYKESSVEYILRVWCATEDYWEVHYDLLEQVKGAFDAAGVEMTYEHLNVHLMK
ncbi:mechanosensitive ion channel domain-containing protein [Candidatus Pseudoscillospira sp. SGI.172]|uniref:mechanosensitive ion channel family protein n=1 Tax=Candidatus Pseudoscillospira sp. SGI.172 TaxID=3420582 RepID=UPI0009BB96D2|nr:mechanosensitive ion channel [Pseudoflavonifractor sp.]MDY3019124.1 mechanosensitive ion channel [Oscillospiraceae bacterium]